MPPLAEEDTKSCVISDSLSFDCSIIFSPIYCSDIQEGIAKSLGIEHVCGL